MAGKYTPLEHYLKAVPADQSEITLGFEQVELILNDKLPPSAYHHQAWWGNERGGMHTHAHAWMDAGGWSIASINSGALSGFGAHEARQAYSGVPEGGRIIAQL